MNVEQIIRRVKRQFGDEANVQINNTDIVDWINDAQREIAIHDDLFQTTSTTAVVNGQDQYHLPPDIMMLRSVRVAGRKLTPVSIEQAAELIPNLNSSPSGVPTHFTVFAAKIDLYPTPNFSDPNDIQLYYTRNPVVAVDPKDVPEIPLQYHNRIVEYCLQKAYELDENWEAANVKGQQFSVGVAEIKGRDVVQDYYPAITSIDEGADW